MAVVMMVLMVVWVLSAGRAGGQPPSQHTGCADKYESTSVEKEDVECRIGLRNCFCGRSRGLRWSKRCGRREMRGIQMAVGHMRVERREGTTRGEPVCI